MATPTQYYVNPAIAGNSGTGTIGDPYGDLQYALNTITRDATNGDQVNIKAGTAEVLAAALTLATYGTPAEGALLILRGYTTAANDGGRAEIDCGGFTMFAGTYQFLQLVDLECHSFGNNNGISMGFGGNAAIRCEVHKGASSPSSKTLLALYGPVYGCYVHDAGTSGTGIQISGAGDTALGNFVHDCATGITLAGVRAQARGNIIVAPAGGTGVTCGVDYGYIENNAVWSATGNTGTGINASSAAGAAGPVVLNNIVCGFSGTGGKGIAATGDVNLLGYNAFYNNATPESVADVLTDLGGDVTLAADPFTNAAIYDFSLTDAAKTALRSAGWPPSYFGAHANTDPHITIGALQYGPTPGASGSVSISPYRGNIG